jgi:uncharacterized protein
VTNEAGLENKVREAVRLLTELQAIDDELRDIQMERGDLPEEVNRLAGKIREYEEFISERSTELEETTKTLTDRTAQLEESRQKLANLQQQLFAVKTTREYDAITAEFNFVKDEITRCENDITNATQRQADRLKQIDERQQELERVRLEEKAKSTDLKEKLAETQVEESALLASREKVVEQLLKPLYAHYERIRKAKDGRGVARIMDGACGGCFAVIPHQTQVNIRKVMDIVLCETCGRIIVP